MRVFVTGATGFIGSAVVPELIQAGHTVLGLTRSETGAATLEAIGAQPLHGDLQDLDSLRQGAAQADAVIHTAFVHDFSRFAECCEIDRRAIEALGETLAGSGRRLIVTSGTGWWGHDEDTPAPPVNPAFPRASEPAAMAFASRGVEPIVIRLPQVHDQEKQGLITYQVEQAREKQRSIYVGDGQMRMAAVHRFDAARLYRLALEKGVPEGCYHAVAEEGVAGHDIAQAIGRRLNTPVVSISAEEAATELGWLAHFLTQDMSSSSTKTRERLEWSPTGPGLLADLDRTSAG